MVRKVDSAVQEESESRVRADVIILGCSLPGIVTAHKLKMRFGDSMDIVVLDLLAPPKSVSKCNVAFQDISDSESSEQEDSPESYDLTTRRLLDNVARHYLAKYAEDLHIPLPNEIIAPEQVKCNLNKVFQHRNGKIVECATDYHDFDYLGLLEKFELNQYQTLLDENMRVLFQTHPDTSEDDRSRLLYYDQTMMEKHICEALFFSTSREIMRTTVRLVCGAPASNISVLFYLHQCYRTSSTRNHLDGDNTRFRDKLLGYCRRRIAHKLQQGIADITQAVKHVKEIRTCSDEQVIVETMKGEATYECNLLAMALKPNELHKIRMEEELLSQETVKVMSSMIPGHAKKFIIQYEENFWSRQGYSGDILSIRGPIIWAMERPKMSNTGSTERSTALTGYLKVRDNSDETNSRDAVLEQLVKLFGEEAATPVNYIESSVADLFIPRSGDYIALRKMANQDSPKFLEWASLDIFADGDVVAALEAGHTAYLHLLSCLRPQAQTFEDIHAAVPPMNLSGHPLPRWLAKVNFVSGVRWSVYLAVSLVALRVVKSLWLK